MADDMSTIVIGAGPYGLSAAAHLQGRGIPTRVFGDPMGFWRAMPQTLYLKSVLSASSLSDPKRKYQITNFFKETGVPRQEPIPLPVFLRYGEWFSENAVKNIDKTFVSNLAHDGKNFQVTLEDGRTEQARHVVVAAGISRFTNVPEFARNLPEHLASHVQHHPDLEKFSGCKVAVIGSGQSGLETSALLHEAGADVELIARGPVIWINRKLYDKAGPARRIFYPPSDVGPPGLNWLTALPQVYKLFPENLRYSFERRAIRPAGAQWLRTRVDRKIKTTEYTNVLRATQKGEQVLIELSDGTKREVDFLMLCTGYRANLEKVPFIDSELMRNIRTRNGYPILTGGFEATVPHLYFVGALAGHTFGPICRFVAGSHASAIQVTKSISA